MNTVKIIAMGMLVAGGTVFADHPVNLSLTPNIAIFDEDEQINGLTLSIWGENPQNSLAIGIVNGSSGNSAGVSLGFLINYADNYKGVMIAPINCVHGDFSGWQAGFVNYTDGVMKGLQTGALNYAGELTGLQLGFVNYAETAASGLQIGLINLLPENEWFSNLPDELAPGMILVNWHF